MRNISTPSMDPQRPLKQRLMVLLNNSAMSSLKIEEAAVYTFSRLPGARHMLQIVAKPAKYFAGKVACGSKHVQGPQPSPGGLESPDFVAEVPDAVL